MDTIYAPATAVVKSGVAVIRVSGLGARNALNTLTKRTALPTPRLATCCKVFSPNGTPIDDALVLWFPGPASFTGEDVVEFHLHGSRAVISAMLDALGTLDGYRYAEAGEFTRRAFENGKMDLTEIEGLGDLLEAETTQQAAQALRQMQGFQSGYYSKWRVQIIRILALLEAYIDFPDEEIPDSVLEETAQHIVSLNQTMQRFLEDDQRGEKLRSGLTAVILGAPNVGKSSLMNTLSKRDVAIVSDIAGTTRDMIEVHLDLNGFPLTIVDTAGLRSKEAADDIEKIGIERALKRAKEADINLVLINAQDLPRIPEETHDLLTNDTPTITIINKTDCVDNLEIPAELQTINALELSLNTGNGIPALVAALEQHVRTHLEGNTPPLITRHRHRALLSQARAQLDGIDMNAPLELITEDLRLSAQYIGQITGHIDVEEILDEIFSSFCIGK